MLISKSIILIEPFNEGIPSSANFRIEEEEINLDEWKAALAEGSMIIQILVISSDPYLRYLMKHSAVDKPGRPVIKANDRLYGYVAGKVLASKHTNWKENDLFGATLPFRTFQLLSKTQIEKTVFWKLTDYLTESEISVGVGLLGNTGATAYGGLMDVLRPQPDEILLVSAASGAVGGLVGKLAKELYHCKVIGICGGPDKGELIKTKFGYDHAIDYRTVQTTEELVQKILEVAPEGVDMYFENVGGIHFSAALEVLRNKGRIAVCGTISEYNSSLSPSLTIHNVNKLIYQQLRIEGILCAEWLRGSRGHFHRDVSQWWREGKLPAEQTVFQGIENWPVAFQSLFTGAHVGKAVVQL